MGVGQGGSCHSPRRVFDSPQRAYGPIPFHAGGDTPRTTLRVRSRLRRIHHSGCSIFDRVSGPAQGWIPTRGWELRGDGGMRRPYFVSAQVLDSSRGRGMTRGEG